MARRKKQRQVKVWGTYDDLVEEYAHPDPQYRSKGSLAIRRGYDNRVFTFVHARGAPLPDLPWWVSPYDILDLTKDHDVNLSTSDYKTTDGARIVRVLVDDIGKGGRQM